MRSDAELKRLRRTRRNRRRWLYRVFCPHIEDVLPCDFQGYPTIAVLVDGSWRAPDFFEHALLAADLARGTPYARYYRRDRPLDSAEMA